MPILNSGALKGGLVPEGSSAPPPASTGFNQTATNMMNSPNYASALVGNYAGQAAPTIAEGELTETQAAAQAGMAPEQIGLGSAYLENQQGYQQAGYENAFQGNQIQQQGLAQQIGTSAQQQGLEQQQYQQQLAQQGVTKEQLGQQQTYLGQQEGTAAQGQQLSQQSLEAQLANLGYQYPLAQQAQAGSAAASGASNTVGEKQAQGTLTQQYGYNTGQLQNQQQQSALGYKEQQQNYANQQAGIGFQSQSDYINNQLAALGQQSEQVGYQGTQEQYANQQQSLQNQLSGLGVSAQQGMSQLTYGLNQLGINTDPTALYGQAAQAGAGVGSDYGAVLSQAGTITGLGPQVGSLGG